MGEQGRWFKLWCSAVTDPHLRNLDVADFGRWAKLGAITKEHGNSGTLVVPSPATGLCADLGVPDFSALMACFARLPHLTVTTALPTALPTAFATAFGAVSGETIATVTFCNWAKYQGDYSTLRVRRLREMKRSKTRRDETRGEEKRKERTTQGKSLRDCAHRVLEFLNQKTGRNFRPVESNLRLIQARLGSGASEANCRGVVARKVRDWKDDPAMARYLRPETLFNATKFESYLGEREPDDPADLS